jgi:S1-C subfamily serine protease
VGVLVALVSVTVGVVGTLGLLAAGGWLSGPTGRGFATSSASLPPAQIRYVDRPDTLRIAAAISPAIVTLVVARGSDDAPAGAQGPAAGTVIASGVVFHDGGWIITNRHVVCGAGAIVVVLADGRQVAGELYGLDSLTDLAIVRIDANGLVAADIGDSTSLRPGATSLVIGSSAASYATTVTSGIVSALGRDLMVEDPCGGGERRALRNVIQTDARVDDDSSGGALVDTAGSVVGITTSIAGDTGMVAYAIPVNIAKPIMEQAIEDKPITRPWMGITYTALNPVIAEAHGLIIDHGAWLRGSTDGSMPAVVPGGPADVAGLQEGDVLTAIDDQRIDSSHPLDDILSQYRPESQDPIEISVFRDGTPLEMPLTLGTRRESS